MTVRLIEVTQAEYWRLREQHSKLTIVYPKYDESKFLLWLAHEFDTEPITDGYQIAVRR